MIKKKTKTYGEPITHIGQLDGRKVVTTWRMTLRVAEQVTKDLKTDGATFVRTFQDGTDCLGGKYRIVGHFRRA